MFFEKAQWSTEDYRSRGGEEQRRSRGPVLDYSSVFTLGDLSGDPASCPDNHTSVSLEGCPPGQPLHLFFNTYKLSSLPTPVFWSQPWWCYAGSSLELPYVDFYLMSHTQSGRNLSSSSKHRHIIWSLCLPLAPLWPEQALPHLRSHGLPSVKSVLHTAAGGSLMKSKCVSAAQKLKNGSPFCSH